MAAAGLLERLLAVDANRGVVVGLILFEFREKLLGSHSGAHRQQADVQEVVRLRVDDGVQSVVISLELDYGFVDRDVLRGLSPVGLYVGVVYPVVNRRAGATGGEHLRNGDSV